ncbi:YozQ family protein [Halobacillus litoralis]|uniref:YozQ family protein n=1 Tax=Halobacillus litoralis TaxID=45668 RepID=UPI001CD48BA9|nr:YozQ family protein [Halobacillus litoralis]MCA0971708.1 YozQ family protein [Halobacillus litoralis]
MRNEKDQRITEEQASDSYMEGTIDGKIDQVDKDGNLISHEGEEIPREGFPKGKKNHEQKK